MMNYIFRYFEGLIDSLPSFNPSSFLSKPTLWYFIKKIRILVFIIALAGLIKAIVDVSVIYVTGLIIDSLNKSEYRSFEFISLYQLLMVAGVLFIVIRPATSFITDLLCNQGIRAKFSPLVRQELYLRVVNNDIAWFNRAHAGKVSAAVWQSGQAVTEFLLSVLQIIWSNVAYILLVTGFMSTVNMAFAAVIIIWLLVWALLSLKYAPQIKRRAGQSAVASNAINGHFVDVFSNIANVRSLSPGGNEKEFISGYMNDFINKSAHFLRTITVAETLHILSSSVAMMAIGYIAVALWGKGQLSVGEISVIFALVFRLEALLTTLMNQIAGAMRAAGLFYSSLDMLHNDNKITDPEQAIPLPVATGDIRFDNVTFAYEAGKPVIHNLNLHIDKGERLAIVGESGSGKSTVLSLLLRFYDASSGVISLAGKDIRQVKQAELRRHFSLVTQDNMLFNRTIYENITFGCDNPSRERVINAARQARALDFIEQASDGVNRGFSTLTGDRGVKLSAGQRQRLSLCRAILRDTPVLILDEATSSLDSVTESDIQASLDAVMAGKTVIVVAHRLSTVINMERIIVLDKGRVIEEGTHTELVGKKGAYYQLWKQQARL